MTVGSIWRVFAPFASWGWLTTMAVDIQSSSARDWAVPAGEVLAEALAERGWTQVELARRTDRPIKTINEIINAKAAITPETALQFELVLGIPAHIWLNLERNYGEWRARNKEFERMTEWSAWVDRFPVADLAKYGLITKSRSKSEKAATLDRKSTRLNSSHRCISYA